MDGPLISQQESTGQGNEQNEIEQIKFYNEVRKKYLRKDYSCTTHLGIESVHPKGNCVFG